MWRERHAETPMKTASLAASLLVVLLFPGISVSGHPRLLQAVARQVRSRQAGLAVRSASSTLRCQLKALG